MTADLGTALAAVDLDPDRSLSVQALLVEAWAAGWDAGKAAGIAAADAAHQAAEDAAEDERTAAWAAAARKIPSQPFSVLAELRGEPERAAVARRHEARVWAGWPGREAS